MSEAGDPGFVRCPVCGEVVGLYEAAVFLLPDGSRLRASLLSAPERVSEAAEAMHAACSDDGESQAT